MSLSLTHWFSRLPPAAWRVWGGHRSICVFVCVMCVLGGLFRLTGPEDDRWPAEQKKLQNFHPLRHVRRNSVPHETPGLSVVTPNYHQQQHPAAPTGRTAPSDGQRFVLSHAQREERKRNRDAHMMPMGCVHAWVLMRVLGCSLVQCEVCLKSGSFCCFSSLFSSQESLFWLTRILPSFLLFLLCFQRFSFLPFPPLKVTLCPIFARQDTFNCISKDSVGLSSLCTAKCVRISCFAVFHVLYLNWHSRPRVRGNVNQKYFLCSF